MATELEYVQYVCEQMKGAGSVVYRKMFGEYGIYCDTKIIGLVCDNQVYIKPTAAGLAQMESPVMEPPYKGAKPYILLEDIDDIEFVTRLIIATCNELPFPKPKKKKATS